MRRTTQRDAILRILHEAQGPLTPKEVHERARALVRSLGLATVYRNLNELEATGTVVPVHLPKDTTRYEPAGRGHHHHFRCTRCETVFELKASCPVSILEGVTLPGGLRVLGHDLVLFGTCDGCTGSADARTEFAAS